MICVFFLFLGIFSVCFASQAHQDGCSVASTAVADTNKGWFLLSVRGLGANAKECRCQHLIAATNWQLWHGCGFVPLLLPATATSPVLSSFPPRLRHPLRVLPHLPHCEKLQRRSFLPNCTHQCHHWRRFLLDRQNADCFPVITTATKKTQNRGTLVCDSFILLFFSTF